MRIINRITASLSAALDNAVGSIENHDAVIGASINEIQRAAGEARARLKRVRTDSARLNEKINTLEANAVRWAKRAIASEDDEEVALECLQRRRDCQQQIEELSKSAQQMHSVEKRLQQSIEQIDSRLRELNQQRYVLRSRQAAAQTNRATETVYQGCAVVDVAETLERWDAEILGMEVTSDIDERVDDLERRFVADEDRASLRAELDKLKNAEED